MTLEQVLSRLECVTGSGGSWRARCPCHDDENPSLSVWLKDGVVRAKCHAGCPNEKVNAALGIFLKARNAKASSIKKRLIDTYVYRDKDGKELFRSRRYDPKSFSQGQMVNGQWVPNLKGICLVLYRLDQLHAAQSFDPAAIGGVAQPPVVFVAEGEKDVHALEKAGALATCNPMGACKWKPAYSESLRGFDVTIVMDKDPRGLEHARQVQRSLQNVAASVRCVQAKSGKDAFDHFAAGYGLEDFVAIDLFEEAADDQDFSVQASGSSNVRSNHLPTGSGPTNIGKGIRPLKSDLANARRFESEHGDDLRYCVDWARWLYWSGNRWHEDDRQSSRVRSMVQTFLERQLESPDSELRRIAEASQSTVRINAILREAQAFPKIAVRASELDAHDHLLGVENGVLDLETAKLVDDPKRYLITKSCNTIWDPNAECSSFEAFIKAISKQRQTIAELILRALAYSLSGSVKEQKFFLLFGPRGRNGKTTLFEALQDLLGPDYCGQINKRLLRNANADSARFAMADIEGKRLVSANETGKNGRLDAEFIKDYVGSKTLKGERKGMDERQFPNRSKLFYAVNSFPEVDWDASFADRVVPIPLEQSFYDPEDPEWREGDLPKDPDILEKFQLERPGMLRLIVATYPLYKAHRLSVPDEVIALLNAYRLENDTVAEWLGDRCTVGPSCRVPTGDAWKDYSDWRKSTAVSGGHRTKKAFKADLLARPGFKEIEPKGVHHLTGLSLRPRVDGFETELEIE